MKIIDLETMEIEDLEMTEEEMEEMFNMLAAIEEYLASTEMIEEAEAPLFNNKIFMAHKTKKVTLFSKKIDNPTEKSKIILGQRGV